MQPISMNQRSAAVDAQAITFGTAPASASAPLRFTISETEGVLADVRVQPATDAHLPFLCRVYAAARADEMATTDWSEVEKEAFIQQQFVFQHRYYHEQHPEAQFLVITRSGRPFGRLYWRSEGDQAGLMDISLLPEYRNAGIGSAILRLLIACADANRQSITLYVEPTNPARRLYRRFAFEVVGDNAAYLKMCRRPLEMSQDMQQETRQGINQ
jgi:ribosomal protein S18 acetylase RimI-like enzyme